MAQKRRKRAFITGITGQDGSYLAEHLITLGYEVYGLVRRTSLDPLMRLDGIVRSPQLHFIYGNLRDRASIARALKEAKPDEIYNLAAQSDVGISFKAPEETHEVNYVGLHNLIKEIVRICPKSRVYHASTSEMFGSTKPPQNENSPFHPVSPYGVAKLKAYRLVQKYRKQGLYICSGILFNHESPRRGEHFVTRKITLAMSKIKLGIQDSFSLGNLDAVRDWGYAGDNVKMIYLMLQQKTPRDYVVATGEAHSVREFVEAAAEVAGIKIHWSGKGLNEVGKDSAGKVLVSVDKKFRRPVEVHNLRGDPSLARSELGWKPEVSFKQLVKMMMEHDLEYVRRKFC